MMLRAEEFHYSCALFVGSSESELLTFIARKKLSNKLRFRYQSGRISQILTSSYRRKYQVVFVEAKLSGIPCRARHYLPRVVMRGLYYAFISPY